MQQALTLPAAGRQFPGTVRQGEDWKAGPYPLSSASFSTNSDCSTSFAWRYDLFCTPIACESMSQLTVEASELFAIVLVYVGKTSALICTVMTDLQM